MARKSLQYGYFLLVGRSRQVRLSHTGTDSSPRQIPQFLVPPRVAGRCGLAGGACDHRPLSCTKITPRFSSAQAPYAPGRLLLLLQSNSPSPSFPPQGAKTCSFRCASSPAHDHYAGSWAGFRHTAPKHGSLLLAGTTDASPGPKRPRSGSQAVMRGFPAPVGVSSHAVAL